MKNFLTLFALCLASVTHSFAQGIVFEEGSWAQVLAKAKAANKPIFIDMYTAWCGPCKVMARDVFPVKEVGDKFNSSFINYKIDAEKGEGVDIAKKYEVRAYPTYLFISPTDETVIHREVAAFPVNEFIAIADLALQKGGYATKGRSLDDYGKEIAAGNHDPDFILEYMTQNSLAKKSNGALADSLFKYLEPAKRLQQPYIEALALNVGSVMSPLYEFIMQHYNTVVGTINPASKMFFEANLVTVNMHLSRYRGAPNPAVPRNLDLFRQIFKDSLRYLEFYYYSPLTSYYTHVKDSSAFLATANEYAHTILLKQTRAQLEQADRNALAEAQNKLERGEVDSTYYKTRLRRAHTNQEQGAIRTANLAFDVLRQSKSKKEQELAQKLADQSIALNPTLNNYVQQAAIYQLTGKTKEAQKILRTTLEKAKEQTGPESSESLRKRFDHLIQLNGRQ